MSAISGWVDNQLTDPFKAHVFPQFTPLEWIITSRVCKIWHARAHQAASHRSFVVALLQNAKCDVIDEMEWRKRCPTEFLKDLSFEGIPELNSSIIGKVAQFFDRMQKGVSFKDYIRGVKGLEREGPICTVLTTPRGLSLDHFVQFFPDKIKPTWGLMHVQGVLGQNKTQEAGQIIIMNGCLNMGWTPKTVIDTQQMQLMLRQPSEPNTQLLEMLGCRRPRGIEILGLSLLTEENFSFCTQCKEEEGFSILTIQRTSENDKLMMFFEGVPVKKEFLGNVAVADLKSDLGPHLPRR